MYGDIGGGGLRATRGGDRCCWYVAVDVVVWTPQLVSWLAIELMRFSITGRQHYDAARFDAAAAAALMMMMMMMVGV